MGTGPEADYWRMLGMIPYNFKESDGTQASVALIDTDPAKHTVHVRFGSSRGIVAWDLAVGSTCTFAGRTWRVLAISTDGRGSADLEATTPAPASSAR